MQRIPFTILLVFQFLYMLTQQAWAKQNESAQADPLQRSPLSWGLIPALAYDADQGLKYGAVVNVFDYGNYDIHPRYHQYLFAKFINSTGGTFQAQALLESDKIISRAKVFAEASFIKDSRLDFFGFNGGNSVYHSRLSDLDHPNFVSNHFYTKQRSILRLRFDLQTHLNGENLRLLTGYKFHHFDISPNSGDFQLLPDYGISSSSLFEQYSQWGIIDPAEKNGGSVHLFSLGMVYDTRNEACYCTDGIWAESFMVFSPVPSMPFSKHIATLRHHKSLAGDNITLSYRISSQQKTHGTIPFYMLSWFFDSRLTNEGPAGAFGLRGIYRNRLVGNGFLTSNFEIKAKVLQFRLIKQEFYASLVAFYDNTLITQPYKFSTENIPVAARDFFFNNQPQKFHHTFGPGLYLVFNKNNIITINYGISTDSQNGPGGLYIGSSMLF